MFGAKNGAGHPSSRPPSALAGGLSKRLLGQQHHQQQQGSGNKLARTDTSGAGTLRRRASSESISSAGSGHEIGASLKTPTTVVQHKSPHPLTPRTNNNLSTHNNNNVPTTNKELNIQVVVRIRNRSDREIKENSPVAVQSQGREILVPSSLGDRAPSKSYSFDRVFTYSDQQCIYNEIVTPILDEVLTGYNCTIFAYGQTGTGKTFTMEGDLRDNFGECSRDAGIIPRTLYTLFAALETKGTEYTVRVSFLELYNEEVKDLLVSDDDRKVVKIFDSIKKQGPIVQGLEEISVYDPPQGIDALRKGSAKRTTAAAKNNNKSSRSHGIFSITFHIQETTDDEEELLKIGKLNLVDLAGSENIACSGAEATQAKEAGRINQSLLTLGRVINSLVEKSQHIPYRESKLTRLLEDSLGGKTKTCIIATISPARSCLEETISTLNYANRAKNIKNTPEINQKMSKKTLIKEYLLEIDRLKADLNATREKNGVFMTQESYRALIDENSSTKDLVSETQKQTDRISQELERVEEKFRENLRLLSSTEQKLSLSNAELGVKRAEVQELTVELVKTKRDLQEETVLRQAHAQTESQLDAVATALRSTLETSIKDNKGLHETLERKNKIEHENREALAHFQERLEVLSGELGERIKGYGSDQTFLLTSITDRLDRTFIETAQNAENTQTFLMTQLRRMNQAMETLTTLESKSSESALAFKQEFEALRQEMTEFLKSRMETSKSNAREGFDSMKKALSEFSGYVEEQQATMTGNVLALVDESTRFSVDTISRHKLALDSYEKATLAEIEFLRRQNQTLRQQLKDQEAKKNEEKSLLLEEIGKLLDGFLKEQTGALMCHFNNTREALEGSNSRLNSAHTEQRAWTTELERLGVHQIQELVNSRAVFEQQSVNIRSNATQETEALVAKTDALGSNIEEDLQSQQSFMQTRVFDMNAKAISGYEGMQSQRAAISEKFSESSNFTITALQDLGNRASTAQAAMESVYRRTTDDVVSMKDQIQHFGNDATHNVNVTREETENVMHRRLKVDDSTEPACRKYQYPQTWVRTRPSEDLLKEFREREQVNVHTTDGHKESRELSESDEDAAHSSSPAER
ncbi:kinesin motor protein cin8 [Modicella reniformis]|uniref:Kinesin motor protein cin8 n=1 Tax=Modicella reniformis TaxID=1440133 RepID=A0A9P6IM58_9FUNG|nr:kinesin motor protein cin8 [Modicella reniformis]